MIINATPHPIRIYRSDVPDRIDPDEHEPVAVYDVGRGVMPARIGEIPLGTQYIDGVPVEYVEYTSHGGLVNPLPSPLAGTWFVVSLVVAIQQTYGMGRRDDLLVPYREVRNLDGTVIGCRQLARPV